MQTGRVTAVEWDTCNITCRECRKQMQKSSLSHHLANIHDIYQHTVVVEELLKEQDRETYEVVANWAGKFPYPYPRCKKLQLNDATTFP